MNRYRYIEDGEWNGEKATHLHLLDNKPLIGVTTAGKVLNKPGLTWWSSGCAVKTLGWTDPKIKKNGKQIGTVPVAERIENASLMQETIKSVTPREYLQMLDDAYKAHTVRLDESAEGGVDLHAQAEAWIKSYMEGNDYEPDNESLKAFAVWARKRVKRFIFSEAHVYSERLWTGGIVDCLLEDIEDRIGVLDFKSSKGIYPSQKIQTAGYAIQLGENGAFTPDGNLILEPTKVDYYAIWSFGMDLQEPETEFRLEKLKKAFEYEVELYKITELGFLD
jgi:hypothetical protein